VIVIDTSALVEYLTGRDARAGAVRAGFAGESLAAPHAIDLECVSSLRGLTLGKKLPQHEAQRALRAFRKLRIERYPHQALLPRIWELRDNMWPYDAAYVALAEQLQARLVTIDGKFTRVPGLRCTVSCLGEG
jgi:predicted nucleic acid-binding protein